MIAALSTLLWPLALWVGLAHYFRSQMNGHRERDKVSAP